MPEGSNLDTGHGPSGNRPAVGAREAHSPPAADSGWQAGAGATDFLGLETDLRGGSGPNAEAGQTESWLFDIEQADAGAPATAVATAAPARTASAAAQAESAEATDAPVDEEYEPEVEPPQPEPARRGSKRVLALVAVLALATAGGWYAWQRFGPKPALAPEIASTTPKPATNGPATNRPAPAKTPTAQVAPAKPAVASEPKPIAPVDAAPTEVAPRALEPDPAPTTEPAVAAAPTEPVAPEPVAATPAPVVATTRTTDAPLERSPNIPAKAPELPAGSPGPGGGRHATERDWAGMWLEPTIPTDAIRGPTRVRTLNVGLVRAELVNGEFVEGTLHAVGESRIWLDVKLGRLSFDASDLRGLVQIVGSQGQPVPLGTQALAGLPRVEVLLPGGSLTGRVLGREGDRVTFVTEDGMRMRVEAIDVRPAPTGRSRLIGPAAAKKP